MTQTLFPVFQYRGDDCRTPHTEKECLLKHVQDEIEVFTVSNLYFGYVFEVAGSHVDQTFHS